MTVTITQNLNVATKPQEVSTRVAMRGRSYIPKQLEE